MIEDKELGIKIAESPREKLIKETIDATEKRIIETELTLECQRDGLRFLKTL